MNSLLNNARFKQYLIQKKAFCLTEKHKKTFKIVSRQKYEDIEVLIIYFDREL